MVKKKILKMKNKKTKNKKSIKKSKKNKKEDEELLTTSEIDDNKMDIEENKPEK